MSTDISIVLSCHNEGRLVHATTRSACKAVEYARGSDIHCEIIVILDRSDHETVEYYSRLKQDNVQVELVDYGDPGQAKNHGVSIASGRYVFFLRAGDLFCRNWLHACFTYLNGTGRNIIAHAEYSVLFDQVVSCRRQVSSTAPSFNAAGLMENNYWDAGCAGGKELFLQYPFPETERVDCPGIEYWHLYAQTVADGIEQHVVPNTAYFTRTLQPLHGNVHPHQEQLFTLQSKLFSQVVRTDRYNEETTR